MLERGAGGSPAIASVAGYRGIARLRGLRRDQGRRRSTCSSRCAARSRRRGVGSSTVCPGFVRTEMTEGNRFPMPFIIEADAAGRAIADGIEHDKAEIVFPTRMMVLMKVARLVPVRLWGALMGRAAG